ncbi:bestrophin-like domain [Microvirga lenta]|uniref:bestrophin-like domain n=1 Tax=Microvirga lenta TaxID=2881337 RepID=UPI001CFFFA5E|nr:DUF4239 domain-containing protein [Microvirga lenta]MCB5176364.1 DUF4239 domain-containing protein [Microvirga lenta]
MIEWLHEMPTLLGAGLLCLIFVVPTLIGSVLLQPAVARLMSGEKDANTLVGLLLNAYTLFYGVLLALLSVSVFDNYGEAQQAIAREASSITTLYRNISSYPEPPRTILLDNLRRYVDEEIGPGWSHQRQDEAASQGMALVTQFGEQIMRFRPDRAMGEDMLHRETLHAFDQFVERRRARIQAAGTNIPTIMWYVVIIGAVLNVFVLWLFDLKRTTHFIFGGVLMVFIGLVIYMVAVLDRPFRGTHGLKPDDLVQARQLMDP